MSIISRDTLKPEYQAKQATKQNGYNSGCASCGNSSNYTSSSIPKFETKTVQPIVANVIVPVSMNVDLNDSPIFKAQLDKVEMAQPLILPQIEVISPIAVSETINKSNIGDIVSEINKEIKKGSKTKRTYKKRNKWNSQ